MDVGENMDVNTVSGCFGLGEVIDDDVGEFDVGHEMAPENKA